MRKLAVALLLVLGLAVRAQAQGPSMAFVNLAYPTGINGDSAAIAAQVLDSVRTYEAGVYRITASLIITTAGSGGTAPRDSVSIACPNGVATQTQVMPGLSENASAGTEVDGTVLCYAAPASTTPITYAVIDGGTQGTHMKFALHVRLERLF